MTDYSGYEGLKRRHIDGDDGASVHEPSSRFRLVEFKDIVLDSTAFWLVKGLIPREGLIVIYGAPKSGKTFIATDLALHIALGWPYRGRRVEQGVVVYIACEGERGLAARIEAFRRARLAGLKDYPWFYLLTTRLDLAVDHVALVAAIRAQIGDFGCAAIVIDTLNRSLSGSESSDQDMGYYIKGADALREAFQCAVIVIHHSGLNETRPRGHTSLTGACDAQIAVKRDQSGTILCAVEHMKDGEAGSEICSTLRRVELGPDLEGEPLTSCVVEPSDAIARRPTKAKKLGDAAKQALEMLYEAMVRHSISAPPSDHIPPGFMGVTKSVWKSYCEKAGIINAKGNPREQLRRIIVTLKGAGLIGVWDEFVWPVTSRHNASQ
jgi:hypothetical protein